LTLTDSGKIPTRVIVIQIVFLVVVAGVFAYVKFYGPKLEKMHEAEQLAQRESRIQDFFNTMVADDSSRTVDAPGIGTTHPQSLRSTPSLDEVEQALGGPDTSSTDYAGGLHLGWIGTKHTLEASFNHSELYALSFKDNDTGHGVNVYTSSAQWQPF
jgi:hypothetical protein